MKLYNGYSYYTHINGIYRLYAKFHGEQQIVFETINKCEMFNYAHSFGMKVIPAERLSTLFCPSFRKVNAKHPVNESLLFIGSVY